MGIYNIVNKLKTIAINIPMVNQSSFGDIMEYDNKPNIKYPYVNIDIVNAQVVNFAQTYTFRLYVCDRNQPYIAYNKAEAIVNTILKNNELFTANYMINYFSIDFKDKVSGVWVDMTIQTPLVTECIASKVVEDESYIITESGDLIKVNN